MIPSDVVFGGQSSRDLSAPVAMTPFSGRERDANREGAGSMGNRSIEIRSEDVENVGRYGNHQNLKLPYLGSDSWI